MKVLIIADSHGNINALNKIIMIEKTFDYLIHCGDGVDDLHCVALPHGTDVIAVSGNIDRANGIHCQSSAVEKIGSFFFFVTHGDIFGAHHDVTGVWSEANRLGCAIACFGHTHKPMNEKTTPYMFNPGAAQRGMYGIIMIGNELKGEIKNTAYY